MKVIYFILAFTLITCWCSGQILTINIPENHFQIDENNSLIISRIENIESYSSLDDFEGIILILDQEEYHINDQVDALSYADSYSLTNINSSNLYTLYFTALPLISIDSDNAIPDEPKVPASFVFVDDNQILTSTVGVELRGGFSLVYPKKNFDLEFWTNGEDEISQDVQFGSMRSDDDWILDALYNEPLRLRSYIANKLWLQMQNPYYLEDEPDAKSGVDVSYVELFLNGSYEGIYNLSEQIDRKLLELKSYNGNVRGELYKGLTWGATTFSALPPFSNNNRTWSGYEMRYPREDDFTEWSNLYSFTDFVMNSADTEFTNTIWDEFDFENYQNYFIFLNLLRASDNTGKNIYLAKYENGAPYFYVPWDLDGCFGTIWDGSEENITEDILSNGLMDRVSELNPDEYAVSIANKWFDFRENIFEINILITSIVSQYNYFLNNRIYERESLLYPEIDFSEAKLLYMTDWLENRLSFLDVYFDNLLSTQGSAIVEEELVFYPNPAKEIVHISNLSQVSNRNYEIRNTLGKLIEEGKIVDGSVSISNLKRGWYLFVLDNKSYRLVVN